MEAEDGCKRERERDKSYGNRLLRHMSDSRALLMGEHFPEASQQMHPLTGPSTLELTGV